MAQKTNAARLLDQLGIRYELREYEVDPDDLAAETFLVAFRQRAKFDGRNGVVRAWLYGIATNLIRRHRRDEVRAWRATAKLPLPTAAK